MSTEQQDTEEQLPDLKKAGCRRIYQETLGGASLDRPELEKCLDRLEKGDTLVVWRLDRLGRSIRDLLQIVDRLDDRALPWLSCQGAPDQGGSDCVAAFAAGLVARTAPNGP